MMGRPGLKDKALVTIGAFHRIFVANFQEHLGVAQGTAAAIAGDAGVVGFDDFGSLNGHGNTQIRGIGGIIAVKL